MGKGFPSMTALLGLVALAGYQNRDKIGEWIQGAAAPSAGSQSGQLRRDQPSGLNNVLGNLGSGGVGGMLSNGLRELMEHFGQNGQQEVAQSWIKQGPNAPITTHDLRSAITPDVLKELSQ